MISLLILVPTIVQGCFPTLPPDDMITVPIITTTTELVTTAEITTTTSPDNSMCQLCPTPYNCVMTPPGALTCQTMPSGMTPMVMRQATGCSIMITCDALAGEHLYVLEEDGTWTSLVDVGYNGFCADANPMPWICDGRQVQRIVCATP